VAKACVNGQCQLEFRRQLNGILSEEWASLLDFLNDIQLSEGRDEVFWCLERTKKYTSRSLYRLMTFGGVMDRRMMTVWHCNILKVKIFIWMAVHDRIQCGVQLKKWTGPEECFMYGKLETSDHILFQCPVAVFLWTFLREYLGWDVSPVSCDSFFREIVERCRGKKHQVTLFLCAGVLWTIWKTRNDVVFNKKMLSSPTALIYKVITLVKTWSPLLKPKLKPMAEDTINLVSANAASM
jgi:hypothetical protein